MNTKTGTNSDNGKTGAKTQEADSSEVLQQVVAMVAVLAPDMEVAALNAEESATDHANRLLIELRPKAEGIVDELEATKRSLAAQKGQTTRARNDLEAVEAQLPPRPRKVGPFDKAERPETTAMLAALDAADEIQLVFLDEDGTEIAGLAPRNLSAKAFARDRFGRLAMKVDSMTVIGPQAGAPYRLAGYALETDGRLLVHGARGDGVLLIGPGVTYELKGDVVL
ncbi:hypothetical protein [Aurantiacibacter zhengii]|uniref:Uncharacterized protein n=1 Tax=Aurantiacibacter zhengii TaxID=2307003 RepID=A0A418NU44_9SPHN|nr:hypothetical protein [Aurantiacibacter zhengii]RIV87494.1 hypothetical protein D2V07_03850 [Aurantiacibacter zhengii]